MRAKAVGSVNDLVKALRAPRDVWVMLPAGAATEIETSPRRQRRRKKSGLIEIELGGGRRIRVDRDVDADALDRVLEVLSRR